MSTQTLTVEAHRVEMLRRLETGRDYEFVTMAEPYLDARPDDAHIRLLAARSCLKMGLVTPAKQLFDVEPLGTSLPPEFSSVRDSLAALPAESEPWSNHAERFDANLSALTGRGRDALAIRSAWEAQSDRYELFADNRGVHQVRERDESGQWRWFPCLADHATADAAQPLPEGITANMPGPFMFEGLGLGGYFERIYLATLDTFLGYSCALFIVEPRPARLAVALHLRDWREILSDSRVLLFAGDDCMDRLRLAWDENLNLPWPTRVFTAGSVVKGPLPRPFEVVEEAADAREQEVRKSLRELESRYAPRSLSYWADRFEAALSGRGEPLRVLAAVSTHTTFLKHSMRDAKRAIEALGHKCVVLMEDAPHHVIGPLTYHNAVREFDPDLFLVLDHLRPELGPIVPENLPVLTWDQDQLPDVITRAKLQQMARHDFMVGCSKVRCVAMGCDPRQHLHARVPTCPEQFSGDQLTDEEVAQYSCDISYVSHASQTPREFHEQERSGFEHPSVGRLLDECYELLAEMLTRSGVADIHVMNSVIAEACRRCGVQDLEEELTIRLRNWYLWRLGDRIFRHQALEWVADWARQRGRSFRIYGNGWDKHPTLSEFAAGPADNGRELLCIYRASRINLQLMPAGFIHQRSLDGLASGGFFLSRLVRFDFHGSTLGRMRTRIHELDITDTRSLVECHDATLRGLLKAYLGNWLETGDHYTIDLLDGIHVAAELLYPAEVFEDFGDIVFDSAAQFARAADRFLADETHRREVTERMRQVVVDCFSYKSAMDHFLRSMAKYLREVST